MIRILHVIDSLFPGGAEILVKNLAQRFRTRGFECDIAVLLRTGSVLEVEAEATGIKVLVTATSSMYSPAHAFAVAKLMRGYDLVHAHLFPAQLWASAAARLSRHRIPVLVTEHTTRTRRRRRIFRPLDVWMYSKYAAVICNSDGTAQSLREWMPDVSQRIHVVPNGIPLEHYRTAPESSDFVFPPEWHPLILSTGRLEVEKDPVTLLRAIAVLRDVHVALIGDGSRRTELQNLAKKLDITARVHFLGRRIDVPQLLKHGDLYVQSSHWEGFGLATAEAMAAGLPVIASDIQGLRDVVGDAGLFFPPGDHAELASLITKVLQHSKMRKTLADAARKAAAAFDIEKTVTGYAEVYHSVLSQLA